MYPTSQQHQHNASWWLDILFLTIVIGSLFFILLGTRPLFVPDEGRYAEIAREMVESGNYVTPYLDYIKYFEKPILFYWLGAASIKIGGLSLWALRSVNALIGLFGCLLTYITARHLYGRMTGLLAALILSTSLLYFVMVHMINLDLPVTVFLSSSLYFFILGINKPQGLTRRFYFWAATAFAALAVLTKGLIGIVFPAMIIGLWMMFFGKWRSLKQMYLPSCLILFLLIAIPWHLLVGERNPEFFYFYFIQQHFLRYTTKEVGHYQPAWFFIPNLIIGFFPWIAFLPQAITSTIPASWKQRSEKISEIFFLLWAIFIFVFFSFSKSKLIPYILPVFPPLSILTARYLHQAIEQKRHLGIKAGYVCLCVLSIAIAYTFLFFVHHTELPDPVLAKKTIYAASVVLVLGSLTSCIYAYRTACKALIITIATAWLFLLLSLAAIPSIETRTIKPLAILLNQYLEPNDIVVTYNQYYQDLPFYLKRRISILNWRNELSFGIEHQLAHDWMMDDNTFWRDWQSDKRVFVIMSIKDYQLVITAHPNEKFYVLGKTINNMLVSNHAVK